MSFPFPAFRYRIWIALSDSELRWLPELGFLHPVFVRPRRLDALDVAPTNILYHHIACGSDLKIYYSWSD